MSRWEPQKNIQFIGQYKQQQCLWDPSHALYKNRNARKAAYMEIKNAMNMESVSEVISRIRMLRNTFNNELLKAKFHRRKSKIKWLPYMQFIKTAAADNCGEFINNAAHDKPREPQIMIKSVESLATQRHEYQPVIRNTDNGQLVRAIKALGHAVSNQSKTDEFDVFGQNVAHQLRQMPLESSLETEEMILAVIRKKRVKIANQQKQAEIIVDDEEPIMKGELCSDGDDDDDEDEPIVMKSNPLESY